jgi:hypothetical protein
MKERKKYVRGKREDEKRSAERERARVREEERKEEIRIIKRKR